MTYLSPEQVDASMAALDTNMVLSEANGVILSLNPTSGTYKIVADRNGMITTYYLLDFQEAKRMFEAETKREPEDLVPLEHITNALFFHANQMYQIMQVGPFHVFGRHSDGSFMLKRQDELTTEYLGSFETAEELHAALTQAMLDSGVRHLDQPILNIVDAANEVADIQSITQNEYVEIARAWPNREASSEGIALQMNTTDDSYWIIQELIYRDSLTHSHRVETKIIGGYPSIQAAVIAFNAEVARK